MDFLTLETHQKLLRISTYLRDWICKILVTEHISYVFGSNEFLHTQEVAADNTYLIEWYETRGEHILCAILSKLLLHKNFEENQTEAVTELQQQLDYFIYINDVDIPISKRFSAEYLVVFNEFIDLLDSRFNTAYKTLMRIRGIT